jgi:hypothetical protein
MRRHNGPPETSNGRRAYERGPGSQGGPGRLVSASRLTTTISCREPSNALCDWIWAFCGLIQAGKERDGLVHAACDSNMFRLH